jgi:tRNA(fMet)-specific endonuclease VapC
VTYLLDTDHISFLQKAVGSEYAALVARMSAHPPSAFAFSVVSFHEQALGAHSVVNRARSTAEIVRGYDLLSDVLNGFMSAPVLPFDAAAAARCDRLRGQQVRIAIMDLRIASIALDRGLILLTRNTRDFRKVQGLLIEDWTV